MTIVMRQGMSQDVVGKSSSLMDGLGYPKYLPKHLKRHIPAPSLPGLLEEGWERPVPRFQLVTWQ